MTGTPTTPRMLDLFCGRLGWGRAFAERGWEVTGVDMAMPSAEFIPEGATVLNLDVLTIDADWIRRRDFGFICASPPCEQFSVHGMKHFHPNPPYPELGIKLFNHTRELCEAAGVPYVMENVRPAQQFVGTATAHCGPFYLWGTGVPPILPQGIKKAIEMGNSKIINRLTGEARTKYRREHTHLGRIGWHGSKERAIATAGFATIPPELAAAVADYATRICEALQEKQLLR